MRPDAARLLVGIMAGCNKITSKVTIVDSNTKNIVGEADFESNECAAWGVASQVIRAHMEKISNYTELVKVKFNSWWIQANVKYPENSDFYMDNLIRLRIFRQEMTGDIKFNPDASYPEEVQQWSEYMNIELTSFGYQFLDACIEKTEPNLSL